MSNKILDPVCAVLLLVFCFAQCKKEPTAQEDQLPAVTQTGANTFGCLVNGKVYIPKGYNGTGTPNPKISIEYFNGNMILGIATNQIEDGNSTGFANIYFTDNLLIPGIYKYPDKFNFSIGWAKVINNCFTPAADTTVKKWGEAIITKFDNANKIVSGNFNFKFKTQTCDTVFVTDGRFDFKF